MNRPGTRRPRGPGPALAGAMAGALLGFGISSSIYHLVAPVLERSSGWTRELQGLLWNLVPLLTVAGGAIGVLAVNSVSRRQRKGN